MTTYTFETLGAGTEALRQAAVRTACMQAAIPVGPDAEQSGQQKLDRRHPAAGRPAEAPELQGVDGRRRDQRG
jgi:hypothetical protein